MDLSSAAAVREFLVLCLTPRGRSKRTPAKLAEVMPDLVRDALEGYAPRLGQLRREAEDVERQARKARKAHVDAFATWLRSSDDDVVAASGGQGRCPQNRTGNFIRIEELAVLGPHFYKDAGDGYLRCVYCGAPAYWGGEKETEPAPRPYVHNSQSVNRTTAKHIVDPADPTVTACPRRFSALPPMPIAEAARLPLCGGCRAVLTGKTD